jgi:chromate reductase
MPADSKFRIVGIAGSLRRASFNRSLLNAAVELSPAQLAIAIHEIGTLPFYNQDVEDEHVPDTVATLRQAVRDADGILIATPEFNYGVPGVLKNAIDWLSRPPRQSALNRRPVAIMGASAGMTGTARAQMQLRQAFVFTNSYVMCQPEVLVSHARDKFDGAGHLTDEPTRQFLARFLNEFASWISRVSA